MVLAINVVGVHSSTANTMGVRFAKRFPVSDQSREYGNPSEDPCERIVKAIIPSGMSDRFKWDVACALGADLGTLDAHAAPTQ